MKIFYIAVRFYELKLYNLKMIIVNKNYLLSSITYIYCIYY